MKTLDEFKKNALVYIQKYKFPLLIILVGILFMMPNVFSSDEKKEEKPMGTEEAFFSLDSFESKLETSLSMIEGAGEVQVVLSLKSGEEAIYAQDIRQSNPGSGTVATSGSYESNISIISDGSYGETPILVKTVYPEFRGAIILCDGADNDTVKLEVTQAVSALCGITYDNITILKRKG